MAVAEGAGALHLGKPVTVNDMMEAIRLPGLKPQDGQYVDFNVAGTLTGITSEAGDNICFVGGAGYTEVVDDIIVEVTDELNANAILSVGRKIDGAANTTTYFLDEVGIPKEVGTYSVLRGNFTSAATWEDTANTEAERTFVPSAGTNASLTYVAATAATGCLRVYARTHYTAVNFGPGL